jgi:hypothetical protein
MNQVMRYIVVVPAGVVVYDLNGMEERRTFAEGTVPAQLQERLAVLSLLKTGEHLQGVGQRLSDQHHYWVWVDEGTL